MRCRLACLYSGLFLLSALLAAPLPLRAAWHHTPVGYPSINSFVTDSSGSRIWLSALRAGLWSSPDGGTSWLPASMGIEVGHLAGSELVSGQSEQRHLLRPPAHSRVHPH